MSHGGVWAAPLPYMAQCGRLKPKFCPGLCVRRRRRVGGGNQGECARASSYLYIMRASSGVYTADVRSGGMKSTRMQSQRPGVGGGPPPPSPHLWAQHTHARPQHRQTHCFSAPTRPSERQGRPVFAAAAADARHVTAGCRLQVATSAEGVSPPAVRFHPCFDHFPADYTLKFSGRKLWTGRCRGALWRTQWAAAARPSRRRNIGKACCQVTPRCT